MRAARMHLATDKILHPDDRKKMNGAAQLLDDEADSRANDTNREALFGGQWLREGADQLN